MPPRRAAASRVVARLLLAVVFGFLVQTLVAYATGLNPAAGPIRIPRPLVSDDDRPPTVLTHVDRYTMLAFSARSPLRDEFRLKYADRRTPQRAQKYVDAWAESQAEILEFNPEYEAYALGFENLPKVPGMAATDILPGGTVSAPPNEIFCRMATGWPFRSCTMQWVRDRDGTQPTFEGALLDPSAVPASWKAGYSMFYPAEETKGAIPARPLPAGTLANTATYAATWLAVIAVVSWVRRSLRTARRLCEFCGYQLAATPGPCPECGATPRPRTQPRRTSPPPD